MRPLLKNTVVALLFLAPLGFLWSRPISKNSELVPLPYKVQKEPILPPAPEVLAKTGPQKVIPPAFGDQPVLTAPAPEESKNQLMRNFSFNYGTLAAEERDAVRLKGAQVGVDYHVDAQQSLGVEGSQQIYDRQDAKAWKKNGKDESTAGIKYKLIF